MAGEPAGTRLADSQPSMDGGLNNVSDDILLQPNQLRETINCRLTEYGAITKRGGTQRTAGALDTGPILNGFTWRKDAPSSPELMAVCDGTLYTSTFGTFPLTWTAQAGTLSSTAPPTFAKFRDAVEDVTYISDGGQLNKWDGTTLTTDLASTIESSVITVHNQRLWATGNAAAPDSIFYSPLNNGDGLGIASAGGGQIIVRTFGDETIVGLASVNTSLLIFHKRGISRLTGYGQSDIEVAPQGVTADVGTIARNSIVSIGNLGYFISERGLYIVNEAEVAAIGTVEKPDPLLAPIRSLTSADFDNIRAEFNRATRELWISIPSYGIYVYHTVLRSWAGPWDSGYLFPATTALIDSVDVNGLPILLRGDADGYVSLCDPPNGGLDNVNANGTGGTLYTMTAQFHRMYSGDDALAKSLRYGYITAKLNGSDSCSLTWRTDMAAGSATLPVSTAGLWGVGNWGTWVWGGPTSKNYRIQLGGTGYYTDVSIVDSSNALPIFSRFQLESYALGRR